MAFHAGSTGSNSVRGTWEIGGSHAAAPTFSPTLATEDPAKKVCKGCERSLPVTHYYREAKGVLGVKARCKDCTEKAKRGRAPQSRVARWKKVHGDYAADDAGCWRWLGQLDQDGYGRKTVDGRKRLAHRVVYEAHRGPIPPGLTLDHLCRVKDCVNPDHLDPVTTQENTRRHWSAA